MIRDLLFLAMLVGVSAAGASRTPALADRPEPEWHRQVCVEFDVC